MAVGVTVAKGHVLEDSCIGYRGVQEEGLDLLNLQALQHRGLLLHRPLRLLDGEVADRRGCRAIPASRDSFLEVVKPLEVGRVLLAAGAVGSPPELLFVVGDLNAPLRLLGGFQLIKHLLGIEDCLLQVETLLPLDLNHLGYNVKEVDADDILDVLAVDFLGPAHLLEDGPLVEQQVGRPLGLKQADLQDHHAQLEHGTLLVVGQVEVPHLLRRVADLLPMHMSALEGG